MPGGSRSTGGSGTGDQQSARRSTIVSTDEQRQRWRRRATWLAHLGLAEDEPVPVEIVEEAANAVLRLVDEVDEARAWARGYEHGVAKLGARCV